ncbi:hypothetical protein PVMG_01035 [Plasmodium vivax Mauritania I]|uniref:Uncharacterized protein n=1 Tax=Plasmodium vivax Mauritania I TaxID=1035515 RepID=A0A0J9TEH3_PLAVI|nr:hypothetical protein PVMG_01035 [Plasmodium vivax Mauritania I]
MKMLELNYYHGEIFEKYKINSVLSALVDKHKLQNESIDFNELSNRKNNYSIMALLGSQIKNFNDDVYKDIDTNDIILALSKLKQIDEQITINESRNKDYILEMAEQMYYEYSQKGHISNENSFHLNGKENFITVNLQLMNEINAGIRSYQNKIPYLRSHWEEKYPRGDALLPVGGAPHHNNGDADNYNTSGLIEREDYYSVKQSELADDRGRNLLGKNTHPSRKNSQVFANRTDEHDQVDELGPNEDDSHLGVLRGANATEYGAEKALCNAGGSGKSNLYQYRKEATNSTYCNSVENVNGPGGASRRSSLNFLGEEEGDGAHVSGINDDRGERMGERLGERSARSTSNHRRRSSLSNGTRYHQGEQALIRDPSKGAYLKRETGLARPSAHMGQARKTAQYERGEEDNNLAENNRRNSALSSAQDLGIAMENEPTTHRRRSFYDAEHVSRINSNMWGHRHTRAHASGSGKGRFEKNGELLRKEDLNYYGAESKRAMSNVNSIMGAYHPGGKIPAHGNIFTKKGLNSNGRNGGNGGNAPNSVLENIDKAEQEIVNNHLKNSLTQNEYVARRMSSILLNPTMPQKEIFGGRVVPPYGHQGHQGHQGQQYPQSVTAFPPRNPSSGNNYPGDLSLQKYSTLGQRKNYTAYTNNNSSYIVSSSVNKNNPSEEDSIIHVLGGRGGTDHENKQFVARPRNSYLMRERNMHFNSVERNNSSNTPLINMDSVSNFSRNVPKSIESNVNLYTNKHSRALDINDLNSNASRNYVNSSNSFKSDFTAMRENYAKMLDRSKSLTSQVYRAPVAQRYM